MASTDILCAISSESLGKLASLYEKHVKWAPHVLSLIRTTIRWKDAKENRYSDCITVLSPGAQWEEDGTIVVLFTFHSYDIFVFTLDKDCTNLQRALISTNRIDYAHPLAAFFCVHEDHIPAVTHVVNVKNLKMSRPDLPFLMYALPPEKSLFPIDPTPEVYVKRLEPCSAEQVNSVWPHRFPGSEAYLSVLIEMNGGFGLFLKSTGRMVAWAVKHCFGHVGMLQTEEEYKKRGYGVLVLKALVREIAEEGNWPFATVYGANEASVRIHEKLGFQGIGKCTYFSAQRI